MRITHRLLVCELHPAVSGRKKKPPLNQRAWLRIVHLRSRRELHSLTLSPYPRPLRRSHPPVSGVSLVDRDFRMFPQFGDVAPLQTRETSGEEGSPVPLFVSKHFPLFLVSRRVGNRILTRPERLVRNVALATFIPSLDPRNNRGSVERLPPSRSRTAAVARFRRRSLTGSRVLLSAVWPRELPPTDAFLRIRNSGSR